MTKEALKLALEALETNNKAWKHLANSGDAGFWEAEEQPFYELSVKAINAIKEALAQPEEQSLHPVHIGVDVTKEGTAVTAFYRKPDAVMEMFYAQFHPLAQPEHGWTPERIAGMARLKEAQDKKLLQRTWVGLTDGDIAEIYNQKDWDIHTNLDYERAIEAKLKEKNT